jgi:poly(3-hydroxybutyrate) depolymerase
MTMRATAESLWYSGKLMSLFKNAATPPAFQKFIEQTLSSAVDFNRLAHNQPTPSFGLNSTRIKGQDVPVHEEVVMDKPFGQLIHFKCNTGPALRHVPKVLIVAPISGHRATILRDTVRELLPDSDVYVTQWKDARDVPVSEGHFDLETYMDYVQQFIRKIGPESHVIGISQSTVPVLAVNALMAARGEPERPLSMTLMCGPIDPRINETEISRQSRKHNIDWFRRNMITQVSHTYPGHGRAVFPGFMQAMGLMMAAPGEKLMTPSSVIGKIFGGQGEKIDADAPYYLDTIQQVFLEHRLPRGEMTWRGERVDLSKIHDTGLFTIEGSNDNITAPGQTVIAHDLCTGLDRSFKRHYQQSGAGHYDVFAGPYWQLKISNEFKDFTRKIAARHGIAYDPPEADQASKHSLKTVAKSSLVA